MKLLYVDDKVERLEVMKARLERLGYQVETAQNGPIALRIFKASAIDLAIVDYYMPGMNGDVVAMEMKRLQPFVPIIIFSGTFTLPEMVMAYVDGFVSTSDEPDALLEKVSELLMKKAARAS
jgi:two-component system response regulator ResD